MEFLPYFLTSFDFQKKRNFCNGYSKCSKNILNLKKNCVQTYKLVIFQL